MAWARASSSAVSRSMTGSASTSAPRAPKCSMPWAAQRRRVRLPAGERGRRHDHHPRPAAAGGREEVRVEGGHRRQEGASADERDGSGHARSLPVLPARARARHHGAQCRREPRTDRVRRTGAAGPASPVSRERWTMLAAILGSASVFLDSTVVNVALLQDRQGAAGVGGRRPRGPDVRHERLPRHARRPRHPGRRPGRLLRPAARVHDRAGVVRRSSRCCAASPRISSCSSCSASSRARPVRCSCRAPCRSSRPRSRGRHAAGRSASGRPLRRRRRSSGPLVGGIFVDIAHLAAGLPHQRPDHPDRALRDAACT